ncbi:metallophosphoesterase [Paenibacillus sp. FSL H8-0548]|uniref:metallophosphoesterase n=1 Tax=Paenibacillus sp. FSL H8-0548 TaxID=1920422 RepID=UPI00096C5704|nr:metallophosphoesterase [Paenibacillus sp. FSL H8-0548]OMF35930.1 metallophosphoesterase [Paenibacillus sp. FSL H8-0548]
MAIILTAAGSVLLLYLFFIFPTQWLKIEKVSHPIGLNKRVLQISDLHVDRLRVSATRIRQEIEKAKPDYIFLTGDYTYKERFIPRVAYYLKVIAGCGVPVYAVLGNHDYELPRLQRLLDVFKAYGIPVLRNENRRVGDFELVGIDNDSTNHSRIRPSFKGIDNKLPIVVITHDPNVLLSIKQPYHYLMAGHLHGKQLNVPFFFVFKPKGPLTVKGIYKGLHKDQNGTFYISKGIGQAGVNARFMVRSEITIHDL